MPIYPFFFQAPENGLIAPDLVIYLDVQPEVFYLYTLSLWCSNMTCVLVFFPCLLCLWCAWCVWLLFHCLHILGDDGHCLALTQLIWPDNNFCFGTLKAVHFDTKVVRQQAKNACCSANFFAHTSTMLSDVCNVKLLFDVTCHLGCVHLNSIHGLSSCFIMVHMNLLLQKAAERGGYGGERYEKIEFQKKVAEHYHSLRDSTWKVTQFLQKLPRWGPCICFASCANDSGFDMCQLKGLELQVKQI